MRLSHVWDGPISTPFHAAEDDLNSNHLDLGDEDDPDSNHLDLDDNQLEYC